MRIGDDPTTDKEEEEAEAPAPPPVYPDPVFLIEKIRVVVPPPSVRVGITHSCYAYHDVDNPDARCEEMIAFAAHAERKPEENSRRDSIRARYAFPRAATPTNGQSITSQKMDSLVALGPGNVSEIMFLFKFRTEVVSRLFHTFTLNEFAVMHIRVYSFGSGRIARQANALSKANAPVTCVDEHC